MTLGLESAWDVFRKLQWEISVYKDAASRRIPHGDRTATEISYPMYAAINAAATSWSLLEWIWRLEGRRNPRVQIELCKILKAPEGAPLRDLKAAIRKIPEIDWCHQIAHAAKHALLTDITAGFKTQVSLDVWEIEGELYLSFNGKTVHEHDHGKSEGSIESLLNTAERWWLHALTNLNIIDTKGIESRR